MAGKLLALAFLVLCIGFAIGLKSNRTGPVTPVDGANYDYEFIYNFTKFLHEKHYFKTFITFNKDRIHSRPPMIVVRSLEQALSEDFKLPVIVWGMASTSKFRNIIGLNNLVFVQISNITDPILDVVDNMLEGLHFISILFFYKEPTGILPTLTEIRTFFEWCWERNIVNVALMFQVIEVTVFDNNKTAKVDIQNQVFNYSPFPNLTIFNVTDHIYNNNSGFIVDKISNVHGYEFKTPIFKQPPSVFLAPSERYCGKQKLCRNNITGTAGRLYSEFINKINGTIRLEIYRNGSYGDNYKRILLAAARKEIHIGVHPFSPQFILANATDGSYPIAQGNVCVIVPLIPEMPFSDYISRPFQTPIWRLMFLVFVMLIVLHYLIENVQSPKGPQKQSALTNLAQSFLYTVHTVLNHPFASKTLQGQKLFFRIFYLKMFFMIFIILNIFTCSLTSLFNRMPVGKQIDTLEDFLDSDYQILISQYEKSIMFDTKRLPIELIPRLRLVSEDVLFQHRNELNTSFAYVVGTDRWQWLQIQQRRLRKPRFRMPSKELCTVSFFQKFPVQWDSPFTLSLALFFMGTQESGLNLKWQDISLHEAQQLKLINVINDLEMCWKPLSLHHFKILATICCAMWTVAVFGFITEILCHKFIKSK